MAKNIKLTILTPEKEFYSSEILRLNTEGEDGRFSILAEHVPIVSTLKPTVTIFTDLSGKELKVFTSTGILRVYTDNVEILCSACEWPEDIDILRTKKAKERAEERLLHKDGIDVKRAENAILRSIMRMKTKE
ncbi:F0F1 ATP synthase subunit epsilon [Clostridium sp. FP1]|uniref:F0F1 ATP synthase subunit epsilon n=1 Tax=Clostridium sp. FP1 TaxID=2724076 RepID=UPI0013E8FC54|nr:F0F1 ATP synthase subunit epsilon [Clostridium sp. FP1]MBZ9633007.1 F0F1 ATP synthase subunit epsilon [Clostridium sp. FP1]